MNALKSFSRTNAAPVSSRYAEPAQFSPRFRSGDWKAKRTVSSEKSSNKVVNFVPRQSPTFRQVATLLKLNSDRCNVQQESVSLVIPQQNQSVSKVSLLESLVVIKKVSETVVISSNGTVSGKGVCVTIEMDSQGEWECELSASLLERVAKILKNTRLFFSYDTEAEMLKISHNSGELNLRAKQPEETAIAHGKTLCEVRLTQEIIDALDHSIYFVSTDKYGQFALKDVAIAEIDGITSIVGTNGHMLSLKEVNAQWNYETTDNNGFYVSPKLIYLINRFDCEGAILRCNEETITVHQGTGLTLCDMRPQKDATASTFIQSCSKVYHEFSYTSTVSFSNKELNTAIANLGWNTTIETTNQEKTIVSGRTKNNDPDTTIETSIPSKEKGEFKIFLNTSYLKAIIKASKQKEGGIEYQEGSNIVRVNGIIIATVEIKDAK
jgi:hypothetical protein